MESKLKKEKQKALPEGWEMVRLGEVLDSSLYGTSDASSEIGNAKVVGMKNIVDGQIVITDDLNFINLNDDVVTKLQIRKDDILFNRTNSYDLVGKVGIVKNIDSYSKYVFASYLVKLIPNKRIIPSYLNYFLNVSRNQRLIKRIATQAVSQANVNPSELKKHLMVIFPKDLTKQQKIVSILDTWSEAIEKLERLIELKKKRFEWVRDRLIFKENQSDITFLSNFISDISTRNKNLNCKKVLSVTNKNGFVDPNVQFSRQIASQDLSNYKVIKKGDFAYNPSRINVGSIACLENYENAVVSPIYVAFSVNEKLLNIDYFRHWLFSKRTFQRIRLRSQGSVRESVNFRDFSSIKIPFTDLGEQERKANMLNSIKEEYEYDTRALFLMKQQKQGLMQKLLSGEILV